MRHATHILTEGEEEETELFSSEVWRAVRRWALGSRLLALMRFWMALRAMAPVDRGRLWEPSGQSSPAEQPEEEQNRKQIRGRDGRPPGC